MTPWTVHTYSLVDYPWATLVKIALDESDLGALTADGPRWTAGVGDQQSRWHKAFYASFTGGYTLRSLYVNFVRSVVAPLFHEPFYYQAVPTFRVHLPGNVAVGEFHTDAQYHHPIDEETFWLPLTDAHDTASCWVADDSGEVAPFNVGIGDVVQFSSARRLHGNYVNSTGRSRVSFDFRCLSVRLLPDVEGPPSPNRKLRFVPGGYYADDVMTP